jgi:hypothetical protein
MSYGGQKKPIQQQIKEGKWRWFGETLRHPHGAIERHALG